MEKNPKCNYCGETVPDMAIGTVDGKVFCDSRCASKAWYYECNGCGEFFPDEEINDGICEGCAEDQDEN